MQNFVVLSSVQFIFRFLPLFLIVYYFAPKVWRNAVLFIGSILFYAAGEPVFVFLLLFLTALNYMVGESLYSQGRRSRRKKPEEAAAFRKRHLFFIVLIDLTVLVMFKAYALLPQGVGLPLGLSFYLFKMLSYQADIYLGKIRHRPTFFSAAAYFTMFPQLTQGPVMRYDDGFFRGGADREYSLDRFEKGVFYVAVGFIMKTLLADRLAFLWTELVKIGFDSISTPLAWLGAFGYSFRLFYDFWGYSLMAAGVGMMLGFSFVENFSHPYAAVGISDFYRRWHMTLGQFFRDYVYIPLGGSRRGAWKTLRNLLIVWLLTGFWHGGTLNFILWGLVLGALIISEKFVLGRLYKRLPVLGRLSVWFFIPLTWVIFAIPKLSELALYFSRLFPFFGETGNVNPYDFTENLKTYGYLFVCALLFCVPRSFRLLTRKRKHPAVLFALCVLFWIAVYYSVKERGNTFMYFDF